MFSFAAFTDEISSDLDHACRVLGEYGVHHLEIRGVDEVNVADMTDDQVREVGRIAQDHGARVCSIGSPFGKCGIHDESAWRTHLDMLRRCAEIAHMLECTLVRGFVFFHEGEAAKPWDLIWKRFEAVPPILEAAAVDLGIENEAACFVGTASHLDTFLGRMKHPRIRGIWDPANHVHDPEGAGMRPCPEGYNLVRPHVVHLHMKDAARPRRGEPENRFMGDGQVDWALQFRRLIEDGYEGCVSLETHVRRDGCPPWLRDRYPADFKGDSREAASRVCLAWAQEQVAGML